MVFYCGAMHQEPEEKVAPLFERMLDALKPGGKLYCVDLFVDDSRTQPAYSSLFQLNMMLMRPDSRVHSLSTVQALMEASGFQQVEARQLEDSLYGMVAGTRG